ncbi:AAA family ATPase [Rhodococcus oryzae]|uniref:AAA family ATPase n=1 Tax=Rhodococcus oryzae TaxID=2571143 RepID=UPI0037B8B736
MKKTGESWSNDNTTAAAYGRLCQALVDAGHIDLQGRVVELSQPDALRAALFRLGADQIDWLTESVSAGWMNLAELGQVVATRDKLMVREHAARLQPDVEPIDIDLVALGEIDLATVSDTADPPLGPYLDGLLPEVGCALLAGKGGVGKTWVCLRACQDAAKASGWATGAAVYLDLDGNGVGKLYARLRLLGMPDDAIRQRSVNIIDPAALGGERRKSTFETLSGILKGLEAAPPRLLIIDSFAKAIAAMGGSENDASDTNRVLGLVEVLRTRCSVVVIDHIGHENTGRPRGAAAKVDTPDTVVMLHLHEDADADVVAAASVLAVKDRHGALRQLAASGDLMASGSHLGVIRVRRGEPYSVDLLTAKAAKEADETASSVARATGTDPNSQRRAEVERCIADSGTGGISKSDLAGLVVKLHSTLALPREDARVFVADVVGELLRSGWVMEMPVRGGTRVVWTAPEPEPEPEPGDPFAGPAAPGWDSIRPQ